MISPRSPRQVPVTFIFARVTTTLKANLKKKGVSDRPAAAKIVVEEPDSL